MERDDISFMLFGLQIRDLQNADVTVTHFDKDVSTARQSTLLGVAAQDPDI